MRRSCAAGPVVPAFGLPNAPMVGRRWMTPRQVRAGVSPALDNVCDQILGDPPRHHAAAITTAGGLVTALTKVLGSADAAPDLERRLRQPIPTVDGQPRCRSIRGDSRAARLLAPRPDDHAPASHTTRTIPAASAPPTTQRTRVSRPAGRPPDRQPAGSSATKPGPREPTLPAISSAAAGSACCWCSRCC